MAKKSSGNASGMSGMDMSGMSGMDMKGMNMQGNNRPEANTDPTKNQMGMDTPPPSINPPGTLMGEGMRNMPMIQPSRIWPVQGNEDWSLLRGFGAATEMVNMINEMMVAGGPMSGMKMGSMNYSMTEIPAPTPEEARNSALAAPPMEAPAPPTAHSSVPAAPTAPEPAAGGAPAAPAQDAGPMTATASLNPKAASVARGNALTITISDSLGRPVVDASVTSSVAMTTMDMGKTHPLFKNVGGGKYQAKIVFGMTGPWKVTINAVAPGLKPLEKAFIFNAK